MKRKEFLKIASVTAASGIFASCSLKPEAITPLLEPDKDIIPGIANFYCSTCRICRAGCGIVVKVWEGRAKKIEGNPLHPVNQGKLCARGQAALQLLYNPDRIKDPLVKIGKRNESKFKAISWKEGLALLSEKLKKPGMLLLTPEFHGSLNNLVSDFSKIFSGTHVEYQFQDQSQFLKASRDIYGQDGLPYYDIANAQYVLSFGADFLETFDSPVHYGVAFGKMRRARPTVRGLFTYVGARMSMTGASADTWVNAKPGSEGLLATGMIKIILRQRLFHAEKIQLSPGDLADLTRITNSLSMNFISRETGLSKSDIASLAKDFTRFQPSIAIGGAHLVNSANGLDTLRIINLLNLFCGNLGKVGGVRLYPSQIPKKSNQDALMQQAMAALHQGKISTLLIHGGINPIYTIPKSSALVKNFAKVPFIVSFASIPDDTSAMADLILPDHADLESWDEVIPLTSGGKDIMSMMQPVVKPVFNTRQFGDVLISLIKNHKQNSSIFKKYPNYVDYLKSQIQSKTGIRDKSKFDSAWQDMLQNGGIFKGKKASLKPKKTNTASIAHLAANNIQHTELKQGSFYLHIFPAPFFNDGALANVPWLQEIPDPTTTVVWGSWVEINPQTAKNLSINHGDLVEVESDFGKVELPAFIYPVIRPDVVAIPLGQGHVNSGRYANGRGVNPLDLVGNKETDKNKIPLSGNTIVRLKRISDKGNLLSAGHPEGSYRGDLIQI